MPLNMGADLNDIGLMIGDCLAVLMTPRPVTTESAREGTKNAEIAVDGRRHLQFTVNIVLYLAVAVGISYFKMSDSLTIALSIRGEA